MDIIKIYDKNNRKLGRALVMLVTLVMVITSLGLQTDISYAATRNEGSQTITPEALSNYKIRTTDHPGTNINLFDYWVPGENENDTPNVYNYNQIATGGTYDPFRGINKGKFILFGNGIDKGKLGNWNAWTGKNAGAYQNMVKNQLGADGYPQVADDIVNNSLDGYNNAKVNGINFSDGESLAYLFEPDNDDFNGDGTINDGKRTYRNVKGLLQKDGKGNYTYDSAKNFAEYDANTNKFNVYSAPLKAKNGGTVVSGGQFFPFTPAANNFREVTQNGVSRIESSNRSDLTNIPEANDERYNHLFGMHMTSTFSQPMSGMNADEPMVFEFDGDDDVWVFLDGVLVGDLGGNHDSQSLKIDFSTGKIVVCNTAYPNQASTRFESTIKDKYDAAGLAGNFAWTSRGEGKTFADGTDHKLDFFYLERGGYLSNLNLKFNLKDYTSDELLKTTPDNQPVAGARFNLYQLEDDSYDITGVDPAASAVTDSDGVLIFRDENNEIVNAESLVQDNNKRFFVIEEVDAPEGYRLTGAKGYFEYIFGDNDAPGKLVRGSQLSEGYSIENKLNIIMNQNALTDSFGEETAAVEQKIASGEGTLFAVAFQKDENGDWHPLLSCDGTITASFGTLQGETPSDANPNVDPVQNKDVIEVAKADKSVAMFMSGAYHLEYANLPGVTDDLVEDIALSLDPGDRDLAAVRASDDSRFDVRLFYIDGTLDDANENTAVKEIYMGGADGYANGIRISYRNRVMVDNERDFVFVQKVDHLGKLIDGAEFSIYRLCDEDGTNVNPAFAQFYNDGEWDYDALRMAVYQNPEQGRWDVTTTKTADLGSTADSIEIEGTSVFPSKFERELLGGGQGAEHQHIDVNDKSTYLTTGDYVIFETAPPEGYAYNREPIHVCINEGGVNVNAGALNDGLRVGKYPAYGYNSMRQKFHVNTVDASMTYLMTEMKEGSGTGDITAGGISAMDPAVEGSVALRYKFDEGLGRFVRWDEDEDRYLRHTSDMFNFSDKGWIFANVMQDDRISNGDGMKVRAFVLDDKYHDETEVNVTLVKKNTGEVSKTIPVAVYDGVGVYNYFESKDEELGSIVIDGLIDDVVYDKDRASNEDVVFFDPNVDELNDSSIRSAGAMYTMVQLRDLNVAGLSVAKNVEYENPLDAPDGEEAATTEKEAYYFTVESYYDGAAEIKLYDRSKDDPDKNIVDYTGPLLMRAEPMAGHVPMAANEERTTLTLMFKNGVCKVPARDGYTLEELYIPSNSEHGAAGVKDYEIVHDVEMNVFEIAHSYGYPRIPVKFYEKDGNSEVEITDVNKLPSLTNTSIKTDNNGHFWIETTPDAEGDYPKKLKVALYDGQKMKVNDLFGDVQYTVRETDSSYELPWSKTDWTTEADETITAYVPSSGGIEMAGIREISQHYEDSALDIAIDFVGDLVGLDGEAIWSESLEVVSDFEPGSTHEIEYTNTMDAMKHTVTYVDGVEDKEVFADDVHENLKKGDKTPEYNGSFLSDKPTRAGYKFIGWETADGGSVSETVVGDATYIAQWEQEKYTVTYVDGVDGKEVFADQTYEDLILDDDTPEYKITSEGGDVVGNPSRTGYDFDGWKTADDVSWAAKVTGTVTYIAQWKVHTNEIKYEYDGTIPDGAPACPVTQQGVEYDSTVDVQAAPSLAGYTFSGWEATEASGISVDAGKFKMPDNAVVFKGSWEANEDSYTVEHYFQNVNDDDYTINNDKTQTITSKYNTSVTADPLAGSNLPVGFVYDDKNPGELRTGTVALNGALVLKLYYNRNTYNISYAYTGDVPSGASDAPSDQTDIRFGKNVSVAAAPTSIPDGYEFTGWTSDGEDVTATTGESFNMPSRNVTFSGSFTAKDTPYTIEYYTEDLTGDGYSLYQTDGAEGNLTGKTDTLTTEVTPITIKGFTFDSDNEQNVLQATIKGDGTTVLKLYYSRNAHEISYVYKGDIPEDAPAPPSKAENVKFAEVNTVEAEPSMINYVFSGWKATTASDVNVDGAGQFEMPDNDVVFEGTWKMREPIKTELDINKIVEKSGNLKPPEQEFEFEAEYDFPSNEEYQGDIEGEELTIELPKIATNGVNTYSNKMSVKGMPDKLRALEEGKGILVVKEKNTAADGWKYSDQLYRLVWNGEMNDGDGGWDIYDETEIQANNGVKDGIETVADISFINTYEKSKEATGDKDSEEDLDDGSDTGDRMHLLPLLLILILSVAGIVSALSIRRRKS